MRGGVHEKGMGQVAGLTRLEVEVLRKLVLQVPEHEYALRDQLRSASVVSRENTGAGLYTDLNIDRDKARLQIERGVLGNVLVKVHGLTHGMVFMLNVSNGWAEFLENRFHSSNL